ncbi:GTPase domain-containing protein [Aspergillus undulatus]|uniref:GTPase domain-containing protein n=1 Tax=Aspergillus undulatus TaxID=1810928 RepID=UPI003CCE1E7C
MNKLSKWLFGRSYTVLVMGEQGSGKTTFIQRLKYGDEKIPQTSFDRNEYMVEYPVNTEWYFREVTVASRDLMPIAREGLAPNTIVLWLHDCQNEPTLDPVMFAMFLREIVDVGCRFFWLVLNKQDVDGVDMETIGNLRQSYEAVFWKFRDEVSGKVLGRGQKVSSKTGEGLWDVLDEMHPPATGLKVKPGPPMRERKEAGWSQGSADNLQSVIEISVSEETLDPDTFWKLFLGGELKTWNHYTYLKAAYFLILSTREGALSVGKAYLTHLTRLHEFAPHLFNTSASQAYLNRTITTFWILQLQHAIREYRQQTMCEDLPTRTEFPQIIRQAPSLMNNHLWHEYHSYSKVHKLRPDQWAPPDKRPLPLATKYRNDPMIVPVRGRESDKLIRYAFTVAGYARRSRSPRGEVVSRALRTLQTTTIRLRTMDSTIPPYSETQVCFWIQIVHAAMQSLESSDPETSRSILPGVDRSNSRTFEEIEEMFKLEATGWRMYYSAKVWDGVEARSRFVLPDIKPLPSVIPPLPADRLSKRQAQINETSLPSIEELSFLAAMAIEETRNMKPDLPITSHAHLLFYLYTNLADNCKQRNRSDSDPEANPLTLGQRARALFTELASPGVNAGAVTLTSAATHRNFWIQQVGVAMLHWEQDPDIAGDSTFAGFITSNLHLVFQELPAIYYSAAVWTAPAAGEMIVEGDRRRLATIEKLGLAEADGWVTV